MVPKSVNLHCYKGQTFRQTLVYKDRRGRIIDLTGATCRAQIRKSLNNKQLVAEFICTVDATHGSITLELPSEVTGEIMPGEYVYDIRTAYQSGNVRYYVDGKFVVTGRVTE